MVTVLKASGEHEPFSEEKLLKSISRAGVPRQLQQKVADHVKEKLYDNITTSEIYHHITEFLSKCEAPYCSAKYSLKQAIAAFGPTGYPFEDFIAEILKAEGYETKVRQVLQGKCITHEVDVVAGKDGKKIMVEAKFHNQPGLRTDTHVALYTKARFEDLESTEKFTSPWLVTNTKVTTDVAKYALCSGIKIMSWSYPDGESIRELIDKYHLHPITALASLDIKQKQQLLNQHVVLCIDIAENPSKLDLLFLSNEEKGKILAEASYVAKS